MFSGYSIGDFVVDLSFQVISSDFSPETRDKSGWHLASHLGTSKKAGASK